jgi:hypothetical protein
MADGAHRLALLEEGAHEAHGVGVGPQDVRVDDATRKDEPVVVRRVGVLHGNVHREGVGLVVMVEPLDLARLERDEVGVAARFLDRLPGLGQLHLLHAVGREERDSLALELVAHFRPPWIRVLS